MKISVITACYNAEATIARTIESFLEQDHPDREMIVIDGASKDGTCDIVRRYDSPLIRLYSEPDKGIYDALNKGIMRASGEVIGLLHANDHFATGQVLSDVARAFRELALDVAYADVAFFSAASPNKTTRRYRSSFFSPARLCIGLMPAHPTMYLRRRVFDTYGLYKTDYKIAGDFEFAARIFRRNQISYRYFNDIWVNMLAGGVSTSGLKSKMTLNREVLRACRDLGIRTNILLLMAKYPLKMLEMIFRD